MSETSKSNTDGETGGLHSTIHFLGTLELIALIMMAIMMGIVTIIIVINDPQFVAQMIKDHLNEIDAKVGHAAPITASIFLGSFALSSLRTQIKNNPVRSYLGTLTMAIMLTGFITYMICEFL